MPETTPIKPGDVVKLKSGGPTMSVTQVNTPDSFECIWFMEGFLQKGYFKTHNLVLAEEPGAETQDWL